MHELIRFVAAQEACERMGNHLTAAVVSNDPRFQLRVLVATDLLARGVDFGRVSLVVQMQAPRDVATYLHRVGRTGRFGTVGLSVLLVADHEAAPALALLRGAGVEPRPLPRALDERDYLQRIESG